MINTITTFLGPFNQYIAYALVILVAVLYFGYLFNKIDALENKNAFLNSSLQSREVEITQLKKDYVVVNNKRKQLQAFKNKLSSLAKPKNIQEINKLMNSMK